MSDSAAKLASRANRLNAYALPSLVLMTDDERSIDPCAAARRLPKASLVIVRARNASRRSDLAMALARIGAERQLFLLVADDPELAIRIGADGVHFPQAHAGDLAYWRARRPGWFFTASAHSQAAVARAQSWGADAVLLSPIFATKSHPGRASLGPLRLRTIARNISVPIYALGGINARTVAQLHGARLAGIAAVEAFAT